MVRDGDPGPLASAPACEADALVLESPGFFQGSVAGFVAAAHPAKQPRILVRIGRLADDRIDSDIALALRLRPFGLVATGLAGVADLEHLASKLAVAEAEAGLPDGSTRIVAVADTARGVLRLATLAGSPRLAGLAWNHAALSADLGADPHEASERPGDPRLLARALTVLAARAAGVPAIDTAFLNPDDLVGLAEHCRAAPP